jgi:hypothetical protein
MRATGTGGPLVAARAGIELPDPDGTLLFNRTWMPAPAPAGTHSPNCRYRCCGTWQLSLPVPSPAPLTGRGGQAHPAATAVPAAPATTAFTASSPEVTASEVTVSLARPAPVQRRRRPAAPAPAVRCASGCGALVAAAYVARTGQDWHGSCPAPAAAAPLAGTAGGVR